MSHAQATFVTIAFCQIVFNTDLSIYLPICLSICLSVCLSVYLHCSMSRLSIGVARGVQWVHLSLHPLGRRKN